MELKLRDLQVGGVFAMVKIVEFGLISRRDEGTAQWVTYWPRSGPTGVKERGEKRDTAVFSYDVLRETQKCNIRCANK